MDQKPKVIIHYASPYYDPVKAHEYYMKNRKLKGRTRSSAVLTDTGKEVWANTKENITKEKKAVLSRKDEDRKKRIEKLRISAQRFKDSIARQIKTMMDAIDKKYQRGSQEVKDSKESGRALARREKQRIADDLKKVVEATRESYKKIKEGIRDNYETIYDREYDAILAEYKKPTKTKKTKRKGVKLKDSKQSQSLSQSDDVDEIEQVLSVMQL